MNQGTNTSSEFRYGDQTDNFHAAGSNFSDEDDLLCTDRYTI